MLQVPQGDDIPFHLHPQLHGILTLDELAMGNLGAQSVLVPHDCGIGIKRCHDVGGI